jgi:hypothetical protein
MKYVSCRIREFSGQISPARALARAIADAASGQFFVAGEPWSQARRSVRGALEVFMARQKWI